MAGKPEAQNCECTECLAMVNSTITGYYRAGFGKIIGDDEHLCIPCASKRIGFRYLDKINEERKE